MLSLVNISVILSDNLVRQIQMSNIKSFFNYDKKA